jgi:hypothetical protein
MAAAGILALSGGEGYAKPLVQEDFRSTVSTGKDGRVVKSGAGFAWTGLGRNSTVEEGGYRVYDIQGLSPQGGTVEMDVTRAGSAESESLFSLGDKDGVGLFSVFVQWESPSHDGGTYPPRLRTSIPGGVRVFYQKVPGDFGVPYTFDGLFLGRRAVGQTFHVALTWGASGPRIYVDGKLLDGETENEEIFATIIPKVAKLVIGGEISATRKGVVYDTPSSQIANVQVHDRQLTPADLGAPFSTGVEMASVSHDAFQAAGFSGKLVAGNKLQVTVQGTPGATGSFDIAHFPESLGTIALDWRGWGVYLEDKTFYEAGEVNLADVVGYRVYSSTTPLPAITADMEPLATLDVEQQTYNIELLAADTPYYVAVVAAMRDGSFRNVIWPVQDVPLAEGAPGVYTGGHVVTYADRIPRGVVIGRLAAGETSVTMAAANTVALDPALTVAVTSSEEVLKADEKSTAKISITVTDANGNPMPDHEIKFLLATTSQYTGVVGGGAFAEQVGGTLKESASGRTDLFGKLTATYVAGFAAKTAVIVARDMASNSTGAAYVRTYIQASADLELEPAKPTAAMDQGYSITVTSSDEWLTADGKSQARITARVELNGKPVEGHAVSFAVSSGTGTIRTVSGTTDADGEARAVYTAGVKIGLVLITATDRTVDISGTVQIELRSDAPAKIVIKLDPEKLPADGRSEAEVLVTVTDINDNPNDNVEVEYAITQGSGKLDAAATTTDRNGETSNSFTAGRTPGTVTISMTVRSTVPTAEEMAAAREMALAVPHYAFR